jgi:CubicO group peptidase (beta-lactamase class C family)
MNTEEGRTLECPSVTIQANAASLGKLAGLLATGGTLAGHNGTPLLSSNAIKLALSEPKYAYDHYMKCHNSYTKGGFCDFSTFDASRSHIVHPQFHEHMRGFYGWGGLGGSFFIFHPEKQVGLAYAMNGMALCSLGGPRTDRIMKACQKVLKLL